MNHDNIQETKVPIISEDSHDLGDININHSVTANIVRLAALEVSGVASVGGGLVDGITEIFTKKGEEKGVKVTTDDSGAYIINIRVILKYGVELATVAEHVQRRVAEQTEKMTSKSVSLVNVFVDGVRTVAEKNNDDWEEDPHTD